VILDPSGQASHWLQAHLKAQGTNFEVVPMHSDRHALANTSAANAATWHSFAVLSCFASFWNANNS